MSDFEKLKRELRLLPLAKMNYVDELNAALKTAQQHYQETGDMESSKAMLDPPDEKWFDYLDELKPQLQDVYQFGQSIGINCQKCLELAECLNEDVARGLIPGANAEIESLKWANPERSDWQENTTKGWARKFDVTEQSVRAWCRNSEPWIRKVNHGRYAINMSHPFIVAKGWKNRN